jgi:hypothetical protein
MKTGILQSISIAAMIVIFPSIFCTELQNPYTDPENSKIDGDRSLKNLPAVLNTFQSYQCTLYVVLPELLDSIKIVRRQGNTSSIVVFKPDPTKADTVVPAVFSITSTDQASIGAYLYRKNGGVDSLVKPLSTQYPRIVSIVLPSKMTVFREYPCSLRVTFPQLVDSIRVMFRIARVDVPVSTIKDVTAADSLLAFPLTVTESGQDSLAVAVFCGGIKADSLKRKLVIQYPPTIAPDSMAYHTYVKDTVPVKFAVTDLDGDIRDCKVWVDSTAGTAVSPPVGTNHAQASVSFKVSASGFDTILVFAQAIDSAGNGSAFAQCTVFVLDTAKPKLSLVRITPSTGDTTVRTLPCNVYVRIQDDSPIDSARFVDSAGLSIHQMTIISDTARALVAALDSGKSTYRVSAWDRAGNAGTLAIPINYTGNVLYKFTFSGIVDRTVNENGIFPSVNLNSSVTITPNPGITTWKDSIQWQILETKPDIGIRATLDTVTNIVSFAVPDSEWSGTESFTFVADWPGMAAGYAGATYTINPINDPPSIKWKGSCMKTAFDSLIVIADTCAVDPDNKSSTLAWSQDTSRSNYFQLLFLTGTRLAKTTGAIVIDPVIDTKIITWNRQWKIVPKPGIKFLTLIKGETWAGTDTLRVTVSDGALSRTADVIVRVTSTCK